MAAAHAAEAGSLDPVALFLQHLASHGYQVGTRELINAHTLWVMLAARRELPAALHDRLALLRPLLCRTRAQQQAFPQLLKQWSPPAGVEAPVARGRRRHREGAAGPVAVGWRRWAWVGVALLLVAALAWWLYQPRPVSLPPPDPPASAATLPPPDQPASQADPEPVADLPGPLPVERGRDADPWLDRAGWIAGALALLLLGAALLRRIALQPLRTDLPLEQRALFGAHAELVPRGAPLLRLVSRELRRPRHTDRLDLDIPQTIAATVRDGGAFTPRHKPRRGTPEYLVLIERRGAHDQLARLAEEIVGVLLRQGVAVDVHRHGGDPSSLEPARLDPQGRLQADPRQRRLRLGELLSRSAGQRLMLFGEASSLLDPVEGGLRPGLAGLGGFGPTVLFTPLPVPSWGDAEHWLARHGVLVLPLQLLAIASAADWLQSQRALLSLDPDWPATYPPRLRRDAMRWVAGNAEPPADELDGLLFELELYLGEERLQWLCACAAFPVPSWSITVALQPLFVGAGRDAVAGALALAALPWFREGRWPLWLRDALQLKLAAPHREAVSAVIQQRLRDAALGRPGTTGPERLADVATESGWRAKLQRAWERFATGAWVRRAGGGLRRDVLFLGFVQQGVVERLLLKVPARLRKLLFREGLPLLGVQAWVPALAVSVVAAGLAVQVPAARSWVEARMGAAARVPLVAALPTGGNVRRAAFSTDGQLIATVTEAGQVAVWQRDGQRLAFVMLSQVFDSVGFTDDGRALLLVGANQARVTWGRDGEIRLTAVPDPFVVGVPNETSVVGQRVVRAGNGRLQVRDRAGDLVADLGVSGQATYAPSGRQVLTFDAGEPSARLWGERLPVRPGLAWRSTVAAAGYVPAQPPPATASQPASAASPAAPPAAPPPRTVPDFIGQDADVLAKNAAGWRQRGLVLEPRTVDAPDFCRGMVVGQSPARGTAVPTGQAVQLDVAENKTQFYPLLCRGAPREVRRTTAARREFTRIEFDFIAGTGPAARGLLPGQCTWVDRAFNANEPTRLQVDVGANALRALRPLLLRPDGHVRFSAASRNPVMRAGCGEVNRQPPPALEAEVAAARPPVQQQAPPEVAASQPPVQQQAPAEVALDDRVNAFFGASRSPAVMETNFEGSVALTRALARRGMSQPEILALGLAVVKRELGGFTLREERASAFNSSRAGAANVANAPLRGSTLPQGVARADFDLYEPPSPRAQQLGNTQPGDGARFRGRGYQQLTGRLNYARYSELVFGDSRLTDKPEMLNDRSVALEVLVADLDRWTRGSKAASPAEWARNAAAGSGQAQDALLSEYESALPLARALLAEIRRNAPTAK